ncbi:TrmH family RNA methyltransferase [Nostocoides australiense]|nr:RNA methyltransferase [Tetrasphaera sp.]HPF79872.1 RNA methyltransferase [Tetrasphaera australiensis]
MTGLVISSPANPRIKAVVALRNRRDRDRAGVTRVEGREELGLALAAGARPRTLFYCPELMNANYSTAAQGPGMDLVAQVRALGTETIECTRAVFEKASYREGPDGFLAVIDAPGRSLTDLDVPDGSLMLIAQGIEKPGNLGAMLRTADAAGVAAVIAADPGTDWGNPNVIRSSKGAVFAVPVASATTAETLAWLGERGYALVATTPDTDLRHTDSDLTGAVAIAVGTEKYGLDEEMFDAATVKVRIPMAGRIDSLNAATAAAIVLFEAVRQRLSVTRTTQDPESTWGESWGP